MVVAGSLLVASASGATSAAECSRSSVPIRILDESVKPGTEIVSADRIDDPSYRTFVSSIIGHLSSQLAASGLCPDEKGEATTSELYFVRRPLVTSGEEALSPLPSRDAWPTSGCRIVSPWVEFAVERTPAPQIRGIFLWSERQMLHDQAVLAGARIVPAEPPAPLRRSTFERLAQDYADSEIRRMPASPATVQPLTDRIPPDLLWLFRHSWQSTRGPFSGAASGALRVAVERVAGSYTEIVLALIDRCFASGAFSHRYNSILDIADVISLEDYRIDQLH